MLQELELALVRAGEQGLALNRIMMVREPELAWVQGPVQEQALSRIMMEQELELALVQGPEQELALNRIMMEQVRQERELIRRMMEREPELNQKLSLDSAGVRW
jgi:predicted metallo-beta-lactamase superfamily hydrolase